MIADIEDAIFPIAFVIVICGIRERSSSNACDTVWKRDTCQTATAIERAIPYARDAVRNHNTC